MTEMLLEWVASSCFLILVVLLLRAALGRRISAALRYGLWAVALARLLLPAAWYASPLAGVSAAGLADALREESVYLLPVQSVSAEDAAKSNLWISDGGQITDGNSFGYARLEDGGKTVTRYADKASPLELLGRAWLAGAAAVAAVLLVSNLRFSARLRRARRPLEGVNAPIPVYAAAGLPSPCLAGLLRPAVYVTEEAAADPVMLRHVLAHELTHYNHLDHLWSVLRGAALAVHWWNPLVWLAAAYSRRDSELACDEGALKRLGDGERAAYGETLLALVTARARPADLLSFATTMSGEKRSLRERVRRIACQPKQLVSAVVAVVAVLSLSAGVAFGRAGEKEGSDGPQAPQREAPSAASRPAGAWKDAVITVDGDGVPHIEYTYRNADSIVSEFLNGEPIPAPREWAEEGGPAGRSEAETLAFSPEIWAKLVSERDGWLVACYGRGVAAADTYVYKTGDGGMNWAEVAMPGTEWHIADAGFLSPERLIVAQRLFDGAPCFITRDGGESWEEIELPDTQALSISFDGGTVAMTVGQYEGKPTFVMTSGDLGDTWTTEPSEYALDHPDDVGSALGDLLEDLAEEDVRGFDGDASGLVRLLRGAERVSRFYTYRSEREAYLGAGADEADYTVWNVPLAGGPVLWLLAGGERENVLMILETPEEAVSAFYDAPELRELICAGGEEDRAEGREPGFEYSAPVAGRLAAAFGETGGEFHYGVDLAAERGTDVAVFADGTVSETGFSAALGHFIALSHADGYSTLYAHCGGVAVEEGESVSMGQKIAEVGASGAATGPTLHFELRRDGTYLDPAEYLEWE